MDIPSSIDRVVHLGCVYHTHKDTYRQRRKESEWWNEEVGRAVAEKRRAFEEWLPRRDRVRYDRYPAPRVAVKLAKRMAVRRWGERLGNDFDGYKKIFWKEVKRVRKG